MLSANFTKAVLVSVFAAYAAAADFDDTNWSTDWKNVGTGTLSDNATPESLHQAYLVDKNIADKNFVKLSSAGITQ